jgi:hypothetical protein
VRNATSPGWFDTMGTPLVNAGTSPTPIAQAPLVAIVNQAFVRRYQQPAAHRPDHALACRR